LSRNAAGIRHTLVLSIDAKLQEIAEQSFGNYRGALVAIDPSNGEVLAFVSKPGYDPVCLSMVSIRQSWDELNNSLDHPLNNRALRGQYPPGSTIKPVHGIAGLFYNTRSAGSDTISGPGLLQSARQQPPISRLEKGGHGSVRYCSRPSSSPATPISTGWRPRWA